METCNMAPQRGRIKRGLHSAPGFRATYSLALPVPSIVYFFKRRLGRCLLLMARYRANYKIKLPIYDQSALAAILGLLIWE
jgi:hypothetical protein